MGHPVRFCFRLALASGLCLGLLAAGDQGRAQPASGGGSGGSGVSTSPQLGEALSPSSPAQIALADYLRAKGVIFYGAYWCPHCFHQKVVFGQEAGNRLPYVECAKEAAAAQACEAAGVTAYPTWVMGKERKVGFLTLEELAAWTLYPGTLNPAGTAPAAATTNPPAPKTP